MRRLVPVLLLGAALGLTLPLVGSTARADVSVRLRSRSLRAVCTRLSERLSVTLTPERSQADFRLLWPEPDETPLPTALARLAELTDSQVAQEERQNGRDRYTLERRAGTARREQGWETAALSSAINRLRLAYVQTARGDRRVAAASSNGHYLRMEHVDLAARFLHLLTLDRLRALATEEEVRFPPDLLTEAEGKRIVRSVARRGLPAEQEETDNDDDPRSLQNLELLRQYGLALQLDRDPGQEGATLMMRFSTPGSDRPYTSFTLGRFLDTELGLPPTRNNPYRVLEGKGVVRPVPLAQLPARLREPLGADLKLPARTPWREALQAFARASELPVASDDYLCRPDFGAMTLAGPLEAAATTSMAEVLDRLCAAYRYLWWEKDGCLYFRSRCWPRDIEIETPPRVVEQLSRALSGHSGQLGAAEVAALSGLTRRQLRGLAGSFLHPSLPGFLKFYGGLSAEQQAAVVVDGAVVQGEPEFAKVGRLVPGEPVRLQLEQQITPIGEKPPRGWEVRAILHAGPVSNSAARSSHYFTFHLPNAEASADAGARKE